MVRERPERRVIIRWSANQNQLPSTVFFLYTILSCYFFIYCTARDTITVNSLLTYGETLVSAGERFELGFFTPKDEVSDNRRYIGIWYYKSNPRVVVWVANRDKPLPAELNGVFAILDGNLKLLDEKGTTYWYTDLGNSPLSNQVAKLMDSGNLVLSDDQFAMSLWESFKYPTDTFLAGMKMDENLALTSWISQYNPAKGNFTFKSGDLADRYIIFKDNNPYWENEESGKFLGADEMLSVVTYLLSNLSRSVKSPYENVSMPTIDFSNKRLTMNFTGQIQYSSKNTANVWSLIWGEPSDRCDILKFCGSFGICNGNNRLECKCLPGFLPKSRENWISGDFSGGCSRHSELCSGNDTFFSLKMMKTGSRDYEIPVANEKECLENCRKNCQCQAYSYYEAKNNARRGSPTTAPTCWIWTEDLYGLREESPNGGHDLHVRVATSDIESTERSCGTCGSNLIPYPLSTKPNCGDPDYFSFQCNTSTGQLSFKALSDTYPVTRIDPDARTFSIQIKHIETDNCGARNSIKSFQLNSSLPFFVASWCNEGPGNSSSDILSKGKYEVKLGWQRPLPPTCTSQKDCENWPHSTCQSEGNQEKRCLCDDTYRWDDVLLNCKENVTTKQDESGPGYTKQDGGLYVGKKKWTLIVGVIVAGVIMSSCTIVYFYLRRKFKRQEDRASLQQNMAVRFNDSARHVKDLVDTDQFKEEDKKAIDLPFFDFEAILSATDNFSEANKLGKGGFGPVYKGKFPGGQEIAVKRLSSVSGQGSEEFKNEIVLIARLQHRNLVRLLGYCIQGGEKILLYEYMPNKSLDSFIFDPTLSALLDWDIRFNIILGIARGLLYLHQDSRLRIIHRDLKTSNVLLDQEMNPKISDFGLAKIFEGKQTEGATTRVVGTYGYMSPEYALDGFFSVKSDVFSFGVVVLEIVSGKRNTGYYNSEAALSLLGYAWRLWQENKALDTMDQKLSASSKTNEILKCINVGLLCVQEDPNDRPNMSNVVIMLGGETATLPTPKQPAFVSRRGPSTSASSSSTKPETNAELTVSLAGR